MKPAKAQKSPVPWSAGPQPKPKRARKAPGTVPVGNLTAMIAEYHQMEEMLALAIDKQEAAANTYFHGGTGPSAPAIDPLANKRPADAPPNIAPIKMEHALRIEDINDAEFSIVALTSRMEATEERILAAAPKSRADGLAKMRFMLSILITDSDQQEKFPDRMIDKCLAALS